MVHKNKVSLEKHIYIRVAKLADIRHMDDEKINHKWLKTQRELNRYDKKLQGRVPKQGLLADEYKRYRKLKKFFADLDNESGRRMFLKDTIRHADL